MNKEKFLKLLSIRYPELTLSQATLEWSTIFKHAETSYCWIKQRPDIVVSGKIGYFRFPKHGPYETMEDACCAAEKFAYQQAWETICWAFPRTVIIKENKNVMD